MDWTRYETMDPDLLVGVVNTALRNHHSSLEDLCKSEGIDQTRLIERLAEAGYEFLSEAKQFR